MADLLKKALALLVGDDSSSRRLKRPLVSLSDRDLIRLESEIGRELFGAVPAGHRREFFCLDKDTWIWYEEWKDVTSGKMRSHTTRYEVHPNGILKVQEGGRYTFIEGDELRNLTVAARMYVERVARELYKRDPVTGAPLTDAPEV